MSLAGDIDLDLGGGEEARGGAATARLRARDPLVTEETKRDVAAAVSDGLLRRRKRLPAWLLYDQQGSALFEEITLLPEYYLTRTERAILTDHAAEMIRAAGPPLSVVELGAGSASKTRILLQALLAQQRRGDYTPVDVSPSALGFAQHQLRDLSRLSVRPVVARYPEELGFLRGLPGRRLVIFLGSNIGNYAPRAARTLLSAVRRQLSPGDALLMGTDLRKSATVLLPAYDDASGVTARFNKNVLERINRVLGARFDGHRFRHVVRWNAAASRVELYLESLLAHTVPIPDLDVAIPFAAGERIHTESSHKFTQTAVRTLLSSAGFRWQRTWRDEHRRFAVHLARVPGPRRAPGRDR